MPATAQEKVDNNSIFELDGNAVGTLDWENFQSKVITDAPGATIFTQGGSKDGNGINQWRHTGGSVPDKDDILHSYAVAKTVNGQLLVYFGADRFDNNGDANIGFWFFQANVSLNANGTFNGNHTNGDLFVVSGFTGGGETSEVDVYRWVCSGTGATCDSTGSLVLISQTVGAAGATCTPGVGTHTACAIANSVVATAPWSYTSKSGSTSFPVSTFFEGGINVGALIPGGDAVCFNKFVVETRSSTSLTAQLKDFTLGDFVTCGIEITKQCGPIGGQAGINSTGTAFTYQFGGQVKNTGGGTLFNVTVTDVFTTGASNISPAGSGTGLTRTYSIGDLAGGQCKRWPGGQVVACDSAPSNLGTFEHTTNGGQLDSASVAAAPTSGGTATVTAGPATATCPTNPTLPSISVTKSCSTTTSTSLAVTVNFSGAVCNQSPFSITGLTATDVQTNSGGTTAIGTSHSVSFGATPVNLAPCSTPGSCTLAGNPTSCRAFTGSYTPTQVSSGTTACDYAFWDKVTATGSVPLLAGTANATVTNSGTANCKLCPCVP